MEMRTIEDIEIGQDLTPSLPPLAFSLFNSSLSTHCSSCFSLLPLPFSTNPHYIPATSPFLYCSPLCSSSHSPLLLQLLTRHPPSDSSDVRAAIHLLTRHNEYPRASANSITNHPIPASRAAVQNDGVMERMLGLLTNREELLKLDDDVSARVKEGAGMIREALAAVGLVAGGGDDCEAALCAVLTNAVEVQDKEGRMVGIAVYDVEFSWINHSCSPNACYLFFGESRVKRCRIAPAAAVDGYGVKLESERTRYGNGLPGPRIRVRSIKATKKGEEVTIAYTDLLQPKVARHSDLWYKYRFNCLCARCSALSLAYVDYALQDIIVVNFNPANLTSYHVYRDEAVKKLKDYIDDAISEYLNFDNAESCCEKLEHVLAHGLPDDQTHPEEKLQRTIRLHTFHHLSLNAYTTLASAYKTLGSDLLAFNTNSDEHQSCAFSKSRISAAYSLLLAGATHHLFLSDSSLIVSVAYIWIAAGEALLILASRSVWSLSEQQNSVPRLSLSNHMCDNCALLDKHKVTFQASTPECENISKGFFNCITNITPKVWTFLIKGAHYLREIEDPIDFRWLSKSIHLHKSDIGADVGKSNANRSFSVCEKEGYVDEKRMNIFRLGAHCLLYGEFLSRICNDKDLYSASSFQSLLYDESSC